MACFDLDSLWEYPVLRNFSQHIEAVHALYSDINAMSLLVSATGEDRQHRSCSREQLKTAGRVKGGIRGACTLNLQPPKTRQHINLLNCLPNSHLQSISSENTNTYFTLPSQKQTTVPLTSWDAQKHGDLRSQPGRHLRDKAGQQAHGFTVSNTDQTVHKVNSTGKDSSPSLRKPLALCWSCEGCLWLAKQRSLQGSRLSDKMQPRRPW